LRGREEVVGVKVALVIVWTIVGLVAGMFVFGELGPLFGYKDMEGESAYFAVMVGAPVGGLAGLFGAIAFARVHAGNRRRLAQGFIVPFAVAVAIPLGVYLYETIRTYDRLDSYGNPVGIGFQVRLPEGMPSPAGAKVGIKLVSSKESPECDIYDAPYGLTEEDGRFILSGNCDLFYAVAERTLVVRIGDEPTYVYDVRVAARPQTGTYSEWFPVDAVVDNGEGARRGGLRDPLRRALTGRRRQGRDENRLMHPTTLLRSSPTARRPEEARSEATGKGK
jgi:hypothetical protein